MGATLECSRLAADEHLSRLAAQRWRDPQHFLIAQEWRREVGNESNHFRPSPRATYGWSAARERTYLSRLVCCTHHQFSGLTDRPNLRKRTLPSAHAKFAPPERVGLVDPELE